MLDGQELFDPNKLLRHSLHDRLLSLSTDRIELLETIERLKAANKIIDLATSDIQLYKDRGKCDTDLANLFYVFKETLNSDPTKRDLKNVLMVLDFGLKIPTSRRVECHAQWKELTFFS